MNPLRTPPLRAGSFPLPKEGDSIKTSVFTRPLNRDSSSGHPALTQLTLDAVAAFKGCVETGDGVGRVAHSPAQIEEWELRPSVRTREKMLGVQGGGKKM